MTTMRVLTLILASLLWGVAPARLQADPITISGSGILHTVCADCIVPLQPVLGFTPAAGDPFTFSFTFDAVPSDGPLPGWYTFGLGSVTVSIGAGTISLPSSMHGVVRNRDPRSDHINFWANALPPFRRGALTFSIDSGYSNLFGTEAWPTDIAAAFNAGDHMTFRVIDRFELGDAATGTIVRFTQTPSPAPVPEPTTIVLLGTGLAGVAARRWRQAERTGASTPSTPKS